MPPSPPPFFTPMIKVAKVYMVIVKSSAVRIKTLMFLDKHVCVYVGKCYLYFIVCKPKRFFLILSFK